MSQKKNSLGANTMLCLFVLILVGAGGLTFLNNIWATNKVCTVESAYLESDSSGGSSGPLPSASVEVQTKECGLLGITNLESPKDMNKAALAEFLAQHQGEKFEFNVKGITLGNDAHDSSGITSTTPVK